MKQHTIKKAVSISGVGLHTGKKVKMTFKPAPENHGYKFQRIDLEAQPVITADISRVISTNRGTTLKSGEATISTIEHVLSALMGLHIDNVLIEIDGPEAPIMDGSAMKFVKLLEKAGREEQANDREYLEIQEPISYRDEKTGAELIALPADHFQITTMIDFNSDILGHQYASLDSMDDYKKEIAASRTFVFLHELEPLLDQDLIKGGDLDNAIVIAARPMSQKKLDALAKRLKKPSMKVDQEGILNTTKLHFENEPELLQQLTRETYQKILQPRMLSGHYQGRILSIISKLINPKNILEIGTYTGYSALCLAEGLQSNGELHTIDINEELIDFQRNTSL